MMKQELLSLLNDSKNSDVSKMVVDSTWEYGEGRVIVYHLKKDIDVNDENLAWKCWTEGAVIDERTRQNEIGMPPEMLVEGKVYVKINGTLHDTTEIFLEMAKELYQQLLRRQR